MGAITTSAPINKEIMTLPHPDMNSFHAVNYISNSLLTQHSTLRDIKILI